MENNVVKADEPDEFAILTATWILASNDENPLMTYKGINYRLDLKTDYDVKRLIKSRGELFRRGVQDFRLKEWKTEMLQSHMKRPLWIRELGDEHAQHEAINSLTPNDVFRSQFRAYSGAEKSSIEIIDWGLQHIERLRKASMESKEQYAKSKEVRWVLGISIISLIVSALNLFAK